MRVLAICESPPTTDAKHGNGSTLITARLLPLLPPDMELHLAYYADRPAPPDIDVLRRAVSVTALPIRDGRLSLLAQPFTRLPRASWQRAGGEDRVRELAREMDVAYLHGLHTFSLGAVMHPPCVAHEIDPWSSYWDARAGTRRGPRRRYDRSQAVRASKLERQMARLAHTYFVVNPDDAGGLQRQLGRPVEAIPNGTERQPVGSPDHVGQARLVGFVGTLDYPPNVAAVSRLCTEIMPRVRHLVPDAQLVVAGRRPLKEVLRHNGGGVQILGEVADTSDVFRRLAVAVYPTSTGMGTKNTVREALAAGCPVIASPAAASGLTTGEGLLLASDDDECVRLLVELLNDARRRNAASRAAARSALRLPTWSDAADRLAAALTSAATGGTRREHDEVVAG